MGEVADMMLEGVLCRSCGVAIGDGCGFPRDCADCRRDKNKERGIEGQQPIGAKTLRTLRAVADAAMLRTCFLPSHAPKQVERLRRGGYVTVSEHGYVYITEAGRVALKESAK